MNMQITRITEENAIYFSNLCPIELLNDMKNLKLGVLSDALKPMSICVTDIDDGKAVIRWIYTDPDMRGRGGAELLILELSELLKNLDLEGIRAEFHADEENLDTFFMEHDFMVGDEQNVYRVPLSDLLYGAYLEQILTHRSKETVTVSLQNATNDKSLMLFFRAHRIDPDYLDEISGEYSFVVMDPEGAVTGGIFVSEWEDGDLHINYLTGSGPSQTVLDLFGALYDALLKKEKSGNLVFSDRLGAGIKLVEKVTGNERDVYRVPGLMYAMKLFV